MTSTSPTALADLIRLLDLEPIKVDTTLLPHGVSWSDGGVQMWMLYDQSSISTPNARGLAGGSIFTQRGRSTP